MQKELYLSAEQENDILCELASRNFWWYCKIKAPEFYQDDAVYLREICEAMQEFENDDNELLVINVPPRHGKSRTAGLYVGWLMGRNHSVKIMTGSYNEKLSRVFSKATRNDIGERKVDLDRIVYSDIFPTTKIQYGSGAVDLWRLEGNTVDNYLATAPNASATGFGCDFMIIDDIIKNAYEANHRGKLDEHYQWFTDTMYSRLEGKRKLILIMTRWATKDLAGRVLDLYHEQGRKYRLITKKAYDGKNMLNERVVNYDHYQNLINTVGEDIVRANYDQEPIDLKGRLYTNFITYTELPEFISIEAICDTADEGKDYLCQIIYGKTRDRKAYILDVYYTRDNMDITEREIARRLTEFKVEKAFLESNFGGKAFAKVIKAKLKELGNDLTIIKTFTQKLNKEARILSNATNVMRQAYFPERWKTMFPLFYLHITEFQRIGNNEQDDGPDTLTMMIEKVNKPLGFSGK